MEYRELGTLKGDVTDYDYEGRAKNYADIVIYECSNCGGAVFDKQQHNRWHNAIEFPSRIR